MQEIEDNRLWREARAARAEAKLLAWVTKPKPFKIIDEVIDWLRRIDGGCGSATRCPFLVLDGDSRMGKTRFACSLFGSAFTLVLNYQGVAAPNLKGFRRGVHKCIVMDEAGHEMVHANKQIFQASLDHVTLGQSTCNEHAYQVCLYETPIIVSTNDWLLNAIDERRAWIATNSVYYRVQEKLFVDDDVLMLEG